MQSKQKTANIKPYAPQSPICASVNNFLLKPFYKILFRLIQNESFMLAKF